MFTNIPAKDVKKGRIRIVRGTRIDRKRVAPGTVLKVPSDVPWSVARGLVTSGKAVCVSEAPIAENREKDLDAATSKKDKGKK